MNLLKQFYQNKILFYSSLGALILALGTGTSLILNNNFSKTPSSSQNQNKIATSSPSTSNNQTSRNDMGDRNSSDPVEKGKALANGNCTGAGSKKLASPPMKPADIGYIEPYGLLAGGHVTPIDHGYYYGKVPMGGPDMYDVLALADGKIVDVSYRPHDPKNYPNSKIKGDYRVVIMYSCTFFSYFDLATSLAADIESQLPSGWETTMHAAPDIDIKVGQVIAKMGGQSLDFAIWDTTKTDPGLLVPTAYNNAEPWKINTVRPLDYFTDQVKQEILPFYLRTVEPRDGVIGQDIDGKAVGNWFLTGTNGYAGIFSYGSGGGGQNGYWSGHLALVHDLFDPASWVFSIGDLNGQPAQYGVKNPSVAPDKVDVSSGLVKYEIGQWMHVDGTGNNWTGQALPKGDLKMKVPSTQGVVLVQMLAKRSLKVEVFLNKSASQVSGFDSNAKTYDRGDNAKMIESNTATHN